MAKKGAHKTGNPNTKLQGQRAGANAPPMPAQRIAYPPVIKNRLNAAMDIHGRKVGTNFVKGKKN